MAAHINDEMLNKMDAYWRAANYLAAGQLYLLDNPLLKEPLKPEHIKKKIVGHWGTVPGQNLIYVHLNRIIKQYNLDMILLSGPVMGTLLAAAVGIAVSGLVTPVLAIIALCVAAVGVIAVQPVFWTMPTQLLSGTALAAGIGFVNLFGAIGGFLAPIVRVQAETLFASSAAGLLTLAGVAIVGVVIIFSLSLTRAVPQRGSVQH